MSGVLSDISTAVGLLKDLKALVHQGGDSMERLGVTQRRLDAAAPVIDALTAGACQLAASSGGGAAAGNLEEHFRGLKDAAASAKAKVLELQADFGGANAVVRIVEGPAVKALAADAAGKLAAAVDKAERAREALDLHLVLLAGAEARAAKVREFTDALEARYVQEITPIMERLEEQAAEMGPRYPEAGFLGAHGVRDQMVQDMRDLWTFWRLVQTREKDDLLPADWWGGNWLGRAGQYRRLGEPLDVANWYYKGKHLGPGGAHYAEGIQDETKDDNRRRPGRYLMIQAKEAAAAAAVCAAPPASSLGKARELQAALGDDKPLAALGNDPAEGELV